MGRIIETVEIENALHPNYKLQFEAMVDTGAAHLVLPMAWKERLGEFRREREARPTLANQTHVRALICGPVDIRIRGFDFVSGEVMFIDMPPVNGEYRPLLGYIVLEHAGAIVDMEKERVVPSGFVDLC